MANIMTKRGMHDNIVTYEHMCDRHDDLQNIPKSQITLGSTAIVLRDDGDQLGVYMADSSKEWVPLLTMGNDSGSSTPAPVDLLRVLSSGDYDADTHVPTVENPEINVVYLMPSVSESENNLFDEWIYTGTEWERFGGVPINNTVTQPDWNQNDATAADYIKNRICYDNGTTVTTLIAGTGELYDDSSDVHQASISIMELTTKDLAITDFDTTATFRILYDDSVHYTGKLQLNGYNRFLGNRPDGTSAVSISDYDATDPNKLHVKIFRDIDHPFPEGKTMIIEKIVDHIKTIDEKYLPKVINDWNQNDPTANDYIKNRICYEQEESWDTIVDYEPAEAIIDNVNNKYIVTYQNNNIDLSKCDLYHEYSIEYEGDEFSEEIFLGYFDKESPDLSYTYDDGSTSVLITSTKIEVAVPIAEYEDEFPASGQLFFGKHIPYVLQKIDQKYLPTLSGKQANWTQKVQTADDFILNKPPIYESDGYYSIIENNTMNKAGYYSHAEGYSAHASSWYSHAEGYLTTTTGEKSHAEGEHSKTMAEASHAEGYYTTAEGKYSHTEGYFTVTPGTAAHAEGTSSVAKGIGSHAEGGDNNSLFNIVLSGEANALTYTISGSIPSILTSTSSSFYSILDVGENISIQITSFDAAAKTITLKTTLSSSAITNQRYRVLCGSVATGTGAHAEGKSIATGNYSHAEGLGTIAAGSAQHVSGMYNIIDDSNYAEIVGNGLTDAETDRSNARTLNWSGNEWLAGTLTVSADPTEDMQVATKKYVDGKKLKNTLDGSGTGATTLGGNPAGRATGQNSVAESSGSATGRNSHAEGWAARATSTAAHAEGYFAQATGSYSHAEGGYSAVDTIFLTGAAGATTYTYTPDKTIIDFVTNDNLVINYNSTIYYISAVDKTAHTITMASTISSSTALTNAEATWGTYSLAMGSMSHAEGQSLSKGHASHSEGSITTAAGNYSHAEGYKTAANKECAHSEGCLTIASGLYSHVEGHVTLAAGENSHAEGYITNARGKSSHSEGSEGGASGDYAHSEGVYCSAEADAAHAEGYCMVAKGKYSHAEGYGSFSKKTYEGVGYDCGTVGQAAHAEGSLTLAIGENSHAECEDTVAYGKGSHAEGGSTVASGNNSHAEGNNTIASGLATHVFGTFNINSNVSVADTPDAKGTMVEIVGNGTADDARSNARTLDWSGNESLSGSLTCQNSITIGSTTITEAQLQSLLALLS